MNAHYEIYFDKLSEIPFSYKFWDETYAISGGYFALAEKNYIKIFDIIMGELLHTLELPAVVKSLAFSNDGEILAVIIEKELSFYDSNNFWSLINKIELNLSGKDVIFQDNNKIFIGYQEGLLESYQWDGTNAIFDQSNSDIVQITSLRMSPSIPGDNGDNYLIVSSGNPYNQIYVVNPLDLMIINNFSGNLRDHDNLFIDTETLVVPDQKLIADLPGKQIKPFSVPDYLKNISFSPTNGFTVYSLATSKNFIISDITQLDMVIAEFPGHFVEFNDVYGLLIEINWDEKKVIISRKTDFIRTLELLFYDLPTEIREGQKQSEFERDENYLRRLESDNKVFNDAYCEYLNENVVLQTSRYDAENETFKINFPLVGPVIIKINIAAEDFSKASSELRIEKITICRHRDNWEIVDMEIRNPRNHYTYNYNKWDNYIWRPREDIKSPPLTMQDSRNAVAIIIANRDYRENSIEPVEYAFNDQELVKDYFLGAFGIPEDNILILRNLTKAQFVSYFRTNGQLSNMITPDYQTDLYIYYTGHGYSFVSENSIEEYLVPNDFSYMSIESTAFSYSELFSFLDQLPVRNSYVFLDACRIGNRDSAITFKLVNNLKIPENVCLITSCKWNEKSYWYDNKEYGLFTYYLMKGIKSRNADYNNDKKLTIKELYEFVADKENGVPFQARLNHSGKKQHPEIYNETEFNEKVLLEYE